MSTFKLIKSFAVALIGFAFCIHKGQRSFDVLCAHDLHVKHKADCKDCRLYCQRRQSVICKSI